MTAYSNDINIYLKWTCVLIKIELHFVQMNSGHLQSLKWLKLETFQVLRPGPPAVLPLHPARGPTMLSGLQWTPPAQCFSHANAARGVRA